MISDESTHATSDVMPDQSDTGTHSSTSGDAFAITSFVLGLVSVVSSWTFFAPIIGLILGIIALRRQTAERTLALWGVWLNAALLTLTVLFAFGIAALLGFGLLASLV